MNPDEKRIAAKQCLEAKYTRVNKLKEDREMRKQNLRAKMEEMQLDPEKQQEAEALHDRNETEHLRSQRLKLTVQDFDQLDIIGRGAFGEVRLCREKTSSNIYAMKKLKKAEMVLKGQVQHVHAELEVMSEADETNEWVVKLHYSFQASGTTPPYPTHRSTPAHAPHRHTAPPHPTHHTDTPLHPSPRTTLHTPLAPPSTSARFPSLAPPPPALGPRRARVPRAGRGVPLLGDGVHPGG